MIQIDSNGNDLNLANLGNLELSLKSPKIEARGGAVASPNKTIMIEWP